MGRKSLAEERTNQIIDAFEHCIITHGFEGATLQRTADQAQVNLGMIHHYIGRKTDLLNAMIARLRSRTEAEMVTFNRYVAAKKRLPMLLSTFFDNESDKSEKVIEALYATGYDNPTVQTALDNINQLYVSIWAAEIGRIHPHLSIERCNEIAFAVLSLAYGRGLLPSESTRSDMWREAALILINNP